MCQEAGVDPELFLNLSNMIPPSGAAGRRQCGPAGGLAVCLADAPST